MPDTDCKHPFLTWLRDNNVSYRLASSRAKRAGFGTSPKYIEQIAIGWSRPSPAIARYIADKLTHGAVTLEQLLFFPYRRPPNKKSNAA